MSIDPLRDPPAAPVGMVSRYVVLEEVGRGGMGRVMRAYDPKLQREVAIKQVHREVLGEETTLRLVAEARAMAKLSHPNVVAIYDVEDISDSGEVVLVMEYVPGMTLWRWLDEAERSWNEIVERFVDAGRGLAAAHAAAGLAATAGGAAGWSIPHSPVTTTAGTSSRSRCPFHPCDDDGSLPSVLPADSASTCGPRR